MDVIDEALATKSTDRTLGLPIRAAVRIGKLTLNRYYGLTDASDVYRIAMGKHSLSHTLSLSNPHFFSSTPTSQVTIFQERRLGR